MYNNIKDFFIFLNEKCVYLVLRNWDNILEDSLYVTGHEDIDVLCEDINSFIELTKAIRVNKEKNRDNYIIRIGNNDVRFDIRWVGDGYYPEEWERAMLKRRIIHNDSFYIMNNEDFFYSLAYHALIHKPFVSDEYLNIINEANRIIANENIILSRGDILDHLNAFLKKESYKVTIPNDPGGFFNINTAKILPHLFPINKRISRFVFYKRRIISSYISRAISHIRK